IKSLFQRPVLRPAVAACIQRRTTPSMSSSGVLRIWSEERMSVDAPRKPIKVAAVGDLHVHDKPVDGSLRTLFADISTHAEVLALCGDLTTMGLPSEAENL